MVFVCQPTHDAFIPFCYFGWMEGSPWWMHSSVHYIGMFDIFECVHTQTKKVIALVARDFFPPHVIDCLNLLSRIARLLFAYLANSKRDNSLLSSVSYYVGFRRKHCLPIYHLIWRQGADKVNADWCWAYLTWAHNGDVVMLWQNGFVIFIDDLSIDWSSMNFVRVMEANLWIVSWIRGTHISGHHSESINWTAPGINCDVRMRRISLHK